MPLDLQIEVLFGLLIGILGTINKYTANLDSISHQEITGLQTKTAEVSTNMNRTIGLRNLQRSRSGPVFGGLNSRLSQKFPDVKSVIGKNKALQNLVK